MCCTMGETCVCVNPVHHKQALRGDPDRFESNDPQTAVSCRTEQDIGAVAMLKCTAVCMFVFEHMHKVCNNQNLRHRNYTSLFAPFSSQLSSAHTALIPLSTFIHILLCHIGISSIPG